MTKVFLMVLKLIKSNHVKALHSMAESTLCSLVIMNSRSLSFRRMTVCKPRTMLHLSEPVKSHQLATLTALLQSSNRQEFTKRTRAWLIRKKQAPCSRSLISISLVKKLLPLRLILLSLTLNTSRSPDSVKTTPIAST